MKGVVDSFAGCSQIIVQADLRDPDAIKATVDSVAKEFGVIHVLVNNAGVFLDHPLESSSYEWWQQAWADTPRINL